MLAYAGPAVPVLALCLVAGGPVGATSPSDLCTRAAQAAAQETAVPLDVLLALTLTETGRSGGQDLQPWPWALNQAGDSMWFDTRDQALDGLQTILASGATNVDIGCFQLNFRWHAAAFASVEDMMDPTQNALYAARLVKDLAGPDQDWIAAAGAYHSRTPEYAERYLDRFRPILASLSDSVDPPPVRSAHNGYPLLQPGARSSGASLVPLKTSARRLIGGP